MRQVHVFVAAVSAAAPAVPAKAAEPVMVQCGREYQAARAAGTLNGMDWNSYRTACADRLKAAPAAAVPAATATSSAVPTAVPPAAASPPIPPAPAAPAQSAGTAAMHARQKQCGAEWRAGEAALVAQTPGLTWPQYWSQCNTRLKAADR